MIQGACLCGAVHWRMDHMPESATACNCTACRRYGTLWAYDFDGEGIHVSGPTKAYVRGERSDSTSVLSAAAWPTGDPSRLTKRVAVASR